MTSPAGPSTPPPPPGPSRRAGSLDPNSPKGREVAERFGNILAELELELAQQDAADRAMGRAA